jgi:transcriptional regulator with XRE-family HTH domain
MSAVGHRDLPQFSITMSSGVDSSARSQSRMSGVKKTRSMVGMDWLHSRMTDLGMSSLEEVAQACGINRGTLYRYFSLEQRPSIDQLPALCDGLKSSPLEVLRALKIQV